MDDIHNGFDQVKDGGNHEDDEGHVMIAVFPFPAHCFCLLFVVLCSRRLTTVILYLILVRLSIVFSNFF